jgi:heptosyltransferase-2
MNNVGNKILIIRLSSIGDILLSTPFIRQARKKFPQSQIDFIVKSEYEELLKYNYHISNLITFNVTQGLKELKEVKKSLIKNKYDYIFDLHNNFRSIYLKIGQFGSKNFKIKKNKIIQFLYVKFKYNKYPQTIPISERYLNVGKMVGIEDDNSGLEIFWNDKIEDSVIQILTNHGVEPKESFLTIAPGAGFYTKKWPIEYYRTLIAYILKNHHIKIVVLGNMHEQEEGKELAKFDKVINLTGKLSLLEAAVVLSKSNLLVSNDSGLMHMATAVKIPVLAIFGSTVKEFGFFPYRSKSKIVENINLYCRPCSHIGRHNCPKKHFKCMNEITPEIVIENFEELLLN